MSVCMNKKWVTWSSLTSGAGIDRPSKYKARSRIPSFLFSLRQAVRADPGVDLVLVF